MSDPIKPKFTRGIRIKPDNLPLENVNGEIKVDSVDNKIKTTLGGSAKEILTNDQVQSLTNKTIDVDNNTVSNIEVDNLKAGVLNVNISTGSPTDTEIPSAKAVRDYVDAKTDAQNEASEISFDPAGTIVATNVQDMGEELDGDIQAHINDTVGAHAASAISNTPAGNLAATDVQGALNELQSDVDTRATQTALNDHIIDATDAHDASAISVIPTGNLAADDVQEALVELQGDVDAINASGYVAGPALSANNSLARFDGLTGKLIKDSNIFVDDSGILTSLNTATISSVQISSGGVTGTGGNLTLQSNGSGTVYSAADFNPLKKLKLQGVADAISTGANVTLPNVSGGYLRLTNPGLVSIDMIDSTSSNGQTFILENKTGNPITINNNTGATATNRILTGSGSPLTLLNDASIQLFYDGGTVSRWQVVGGTGSGKGEGIGGADILFSQTFESADLADFTQTGLFLDTASPLHNEVSAKLTHQASVDQSFKQVIPVDPKFRGQINQISLQVKSAASAGNVTLNIYDETNAANILASEQLLLSNDASGTRNVFSFTVPSTCASLSYTITALPQAGSPVTLVDDIVIQLESVTLVTEALVQESDSQITVNTGNGRASTNTNVRRFSILSKNIGSAIQYNDSATLGASFTVLESGVYDITYTDRVADGNTGRIAISVNALGTDLTTTDIYSISSKIATGAILGAADTTSASTITTSVFLNVGDIIRAHINATTYSTTSVVQFNITKQSSLKQVNVNPNSKITIPTSELRMEGASTRGSTATAIVRFDNVAKIRGDAFEVVSNAVDGTYVRMKKSGKLDISVSLLATNASIFITKNQVVLTSVPTASETMAVQSDAGSQYSSASCNILVNAGDIIRVSTLVNPTANMGNSLNLSFQEQEIQVSVSNTLPQFSESDSSVRVDTANGYGSTATKIRRFSNIRDNIGTDIEYVDSATDGASFKVKSAGIYNISYSDSFTTSVYFGLSKNSAELTTNVATIATASRLSIGTTDASSGFPETVSWSGYLQAGDVIRAHSEGSATGIADRAQFTISKVGKPNVTGVDVTPFVNVPMPESQYIQQSTASTSFTSNIARFSALTKNTNDGIIRYSDDATNGTRFTALKKSRINISVNGTSDSSASLQIRKNGSAVSSAYVALANNTLCPSVEIDLDIGDYLEVFRTGAGVSNVFNLYLVATATSDNIISPTESFSTDTAQLTYAPSTTYTLSTLANAPVGTYITFTYAANTNTRTQTTTRPTQTDADMNVNGIQIFTRAYNANSTAAQPAAIAIQIGKGLKGRELDLFFSTAKALPFPLIDCQYSNATNTQEIGVFRTYSEITGILEIDAGFRLSNGNTSVFLGIDAANNAGRASGYLVINASKSPALTGVPALIPRIATLSDVKASGTAGGTATAGAYQTRTLNTIDDPTGIVTSLASNQFTLPAGEFYIEAIAPAFFVVGHKAKLRNITDGVDTLIGTTMRVGIIAAADSTTVHSNIVGKVVISSPKTFEIQHRVGTTRATDGFGSAASFGDNETYTICKITKIK